MDPYVGEIKLVGFNFEPLGWMTCDGRQLLISDNRYQALFSIIGNMYGGDGAVNFNLPNLNGRGIVGGGMTRHYGETGGAIQTVLTMQTMPAHTHGATVTFTKTPTVSANIAVNTTGGTVPLPTNAYLAPTMKSGTAVKTYATASTGTDALAGVTANGSASGLVTVTGQGMLAPIPMPTLPPVLYCNYIIAYEGLYPVRP